MTKAGPFYDVPAPSPGSKNACQGAIMCPGRAAPAEDHAEKRRRVGAGRHTGKKTGDAATALQRSAGSASSRLSHWLRPLELIPPALGPQVSISHPWGGDAAAPALPDNTKLLGAVKSRYVRGLATTVHAECWVCLRRRYCRPDLAEQRRHFTHSSFILRQSVHSGGGWL